MPDKRETPGSTDSSLNTASTLIARRDAMRSNFGRIAGGNTAAAIQGADVSPQNAEWLDDNSVSVDAVVTMERIRQQHWTAYKRLMAFADDFAGLRILHGLVEYRQGIGYERLAEYAQTSKRTVRRKVKTLADLNVVERNGKPTSVVFVDEEREFLAVDAAATKF